MKRRECIIIQLSNIINNCDNREICELLFAFREVKQLYGYSVATLMSFEEQTIGEQSGKEVGTMMESGEYYKLFDEWMERLI